MAKIKELFSLQHFNNYSTKEKIIFILKVFLCLLTSVALFVSINNNVTYLLIACILCLCVVNLFQVKNNFLLFLLLAIIGYCTYSICMYNYVLPINDLFVGFRGTGIGHISLQVLATFTLIYSAFIPLKIKQFDETKLYSKKSAHWLIHLLIVVAVTTIIILISSNNSFSRIYKFGYVFGYVYLILILGVYFTGNTKIKYAYLILIMVYAILNFLHGERLYAIQSLLFAYIYFCPKKIKTNVLVLIPLFIVGYLALTYIGAYRSTSLSFNFEKLKEVLKVAFDWRFSFDTAASSYYTGQTFVAQALTDSVGTRLHMFLIWFASIFAGSRILPQSSLADYTKQFYDHRFGGTLYSHFYYYLGIIGVVLIGLAIALIINAICKNNSNKNHPRAFVCAYLVTTTFTWQLYHPSSLTRGLLILLLGFYGIMFGNYVLNKLFKQNNIGNYTTTIKNVKDILYVSNVCSEQEYNLLFANVSQKVSQQSQRFNRLMAEGFALNGCNVDVISGRPVSRLQKQLFYSKKQETVNGVAYNYAGFINLPIIRNICLYVQAKRFARKWLKAHPQGLMVCDALNMSVVLACSSVFNSKHLPVVTFVTDLPNDLMVDRTDAAAKYFTDKFNQIIASSTHLVLLSKYMNDKLSSNKPYVVIEGCADSKKEIKAAKKSSKKIVMYAGLLYKKYGVSTLFNAFVKANLANTELHFYGLGAKNEADDALQEILASDNKKVKYMGSVSNSECVQKESEATLLVNPRPSNEEFVKYSFPSKNIEYMSTGTPLITTKLPSMPDEYNKYCYTFDNESVDGMAKTLKKILNKDINELHQFGKAAQKFILKEKNNKAQTAKIIKLIEE